MINTTAQLSPSSPHSHEPVASARVFAIADLRIPRFPYPDSILDRQNTYTNMCILCLAQKWSRRVATMLPWLLIPLSAVWALSQLLPPPLRFEIGSHQLACAVLLLVIILWYEVLGPRLAVWRVRRAARLQELRRVQAVELQRLRKSATRRCRNCHFAYRDQNPGGGGRFMCSYCGHVSKRPVLDIPKMGRDFDWNWAPDDWVPDGRCSTERSYVLVCWLLSCVFVTVRFVWRKVSGVGSSGEDCDGEGKELSSRIQESRVEKARRKAEERRQARLEKETLEAEERKQREEVARLVEERRRLRDEKLEAEKKNSESRVSGERNGGKETERKKQERRKEKDKGSNKSNSDGEESEKSGGRGSERKPECDKKTEAVSTKSNASELLQGSKIAADNTRYLDRMKGTFLASSKSFNSATFFGRNAQNPVSTRVSKPAAGFVEHKPSHGSLNDSHSAGNVIARSTQGNHQPLGQDAQPRTTGLKKSWHQLFTRASVVSSNPYTDTNSWSTLNNQGEVRSTESSEQTTPLNLSTDSQINSGRTLSSTTHPSADGFINNNLITHTADETMSAPLVTQTGHEDAELFEDPCYIPEPSSLFGPVLRDDFPQNFGAGFVTEGHHILKNVYASADVNKPSPIKPPMSRLRGSEEKYAASGQAICPPKSQKAHSSNLDDSSKAHEQGTWQMWGTPLAHDALGVIGRPSGWSFPIGLRESVQEDVLPLSHNNMLSKHGKENHAMPAIVSRESQLVSNPQNGGLFSPVGHCLNESDPCMQNALSQFPVDGGSHFLPHDLIDNIAHNEVTYVIPDSSAAGHPIELPPASSWSTGQWRMRGAEDVRGQFVRTDPGVQPKWSFD